MNSIPSVYEQNRRKYLKGLAEEFGVDEDIVFALADTLGPSEDHDGLIAELEDIAYLNDLGISY